MSVVNSATSPQLNISRRSLKGGSVGVWLNYATGWNSEESRLDSREREENFLLSKVSSPALQHIQPHVPHFPWVKRPELKTIYLALLQKWSYTSISPYIFKVSTAITFTCTSPHILK